MNSPQRTACLAKGYNSDKWIGYGQKKTIEMESKPINPVSVKSGTEQAHIDNMHFLYNISLLIPLHNPYTAEAFPGNSKY